MLVKSLANLLSPSGGGARLSILMFHRVLPAKDRICRTIPDRRRFDAVLGWLQRNFTVLQLNEAVDRLRQGTLPARAAAITFDDGYADNLLHAVPVLKKHGLPATFFIATDFLDGGIMWNDALGETICRTAQRSFDGERLGLDLGVLPLETEIERRQALGKLIRAVKHLPYAERQQTVETIAREGAVQLPTDLMLNSAQLRDLAAAGMGVGAHTLTHPILAACDDELARKEISGSKQVLEVLLNREIRLFAYPNGKPDQDYRQVHTRMVREAGFSAALSTAPGAATQGDDVFQLPRYTPWRENRFGFTAQMLHNLILAKKHGTKLASS